MDREKKSGIGVSKKGGQEGNKADWRKKRGTEGEMRPNEREERVGGVQRAYGS